MSRDFDRYMVHVDAGTDEKFATLTDGEFRAHIVGVLAVAAKSPVRGYLFVGELEAEPVHIARRAGVTERVAASAIRKLKAVGVLVHDDEVGAWRVHHWDRHQPDRRDPTAAERAAAYRARRAAARDAERDPSRDGHVTTAAESRSPSREARGLPKVLEVRKGEEEIPPNPPRGNRKKDLEAFEETAVAWMAAIGVTGDRRRLVRAYGQAAPWRDGDAPAFRAFCRQHFPSLSVVRDLEAA